MPTIDPGKLIFQCVKTSLKSVVKDPIVIEKLTNAAVLTSRIMTHTLQFIKLYFIYLYDHGIPLPTLDKPFVTSVMKVLCDSSSSGRPPKAETLRIKEVLARFYAEHYEPIMLDTLNYRHLNTVLDYMAIDVITMYENNIKQHYCQYVERFVNVSFQKRERIEAINATKVSVGQRKAQTNLLCRELRKVKNDILGVNDPKTSDPQFHNWIDEQRPRVMPQRVLKEDSVFYDIQCTPQDYLPKMVYMMKAVEAIGNTISSVFPLRSQLIPKHFRLDTTSLVFLLFTNQNGKRTGVTRDGNLRKRQSDVWGL